MQVSETLAIMLIMVMLREIVATAISIEKDSFDRRGKTVANGHSRPEDATGDPAFWKSREAAYNTLARFGEHVASYEPDSSDGFLV
jgi:hypothetical protein